MHAPVKAALITTVTGGLMLMGAPAFAETSVPEPDTFTSAFTVMATPDTIINPEGQAVPGAAGASATYNFRINSDQEIICYDITTVGIAPPYQSPAKTATHVHAAPAGSGGPPRLAFPDPTGEGNTRTSKGCLQGPFTTGLEGPDGQDTGTGFTLAQIEANPAGFSADVHTAANPAGAVRGQLTPMPVGGVATGAGGTSGTDTSLVLLLSGGLSALAVGGVVLARRLAPASL